MCTGEGCRRVSKRRFAPPKWIVWHRPWGHQNQAGCTRGHRPWGHQAGCTDHGGIKIKQAAQTMGASKSSRLHRPWGHQAGCTRPTRTVLQLLSVCTLVVTQHVADRPTHNVLRTGPHTICCTQAHTSYVAHTSTSQDPSACHATTMHTQDCTHAKECLHAKKSVCTHCAHVQAPLWDGHIRKQQLHERGLGSHAMLPTCPPTCHQHLHTKSTHL